MTTIPLAIPRPVHPTGIWSWITTIDHKRIGVLYGVTAFIMFFSGGIEAMLIRVQLMRPEQSLVTPEIFNQLFTMHATTMIFLGVMPLSAAFFNFVVPLQIGARDVAFPRLNAFSYWTFLAGALILKLSWFTHAAPNGGWFGYSPLTGITYNMGHGIDVWILSLQVLGVASLAASFNFIVTILNMRAPGMKLMRMPLFTWMTLVTAILLVLAFPVITVALIELFFDRAFGMNFFNVAAGANAVLWQHLFWVFGHPEVYILILPAMGIVSEVLPVFSRKPLFGYATVVLAGVIIAFMGWMVWSHHMFTVGLGPVANSVFTVTTMMIAVPTGIKVFNWMGIVSEVLPVFSRKPLFGYATVVLAGVIIAFMGWMVWSHHMFTVGLGPVANSVFTVTTMMIAVPTGIKVFNWMGTMWGGSINLKTPMLFAIAFVSMFVIGGISGVMHAVAASDAQQQDTYFIVAHIHYVLFGGAIFAILAGVYYWFPKLTGRMYNEKMGQIHFWLMFIGQNATFFPMHFTGLNGMPRRIYAYYGGMGWDFWNLVSTVGAFILAAGFVIFIYNMSRSWRSGERASADPWDARTLEWSIPSPPPEYNFAEIPHVQDRDDWWEEKQRRRERREVPVVAGGSDQEEGHNIHLPQPSYWPFFVSLGIFIVGFGLVYLMNMNEAGVRTVNYVALTTAVVGVFIGMVSVYAWSFEPVNDPDPNGEHGAY